jgi:hypothetical protein
VLDGLALARILDIVLAAVRDVVQHITPDDCDDPEFPTSFRLQWTTMATGSCDALNVTHCYKNLHLKPCCTDVEDAQPLCKVHPEEEVLDMNAKFFFEDQILLSHTRQQ